MQRMIPRLSKLIQEQNQTCRSQMVLLSGREAVPVSVLQKQIHPEKPDQILRVLVCLTPDTVLLKSQPIRLEELVSWNMSLILFVLLTLQ